MLAAFSQNAAVVTEQKQCIVQGGPGLPAPLVYADNDMATGLFSRVTQNLCLLPWDFHGFLVERHPSVLAQVSFSLGQSPRPVRESGNPCFRKYDELGAVAPGFTNQTASFFHGPLAVQKYRRRLNHRGQIFFEWYAHIRLDASWIIQKRANGAPLYTRGVM